MNSKRIRYLSTVVLPLALLLATGYGSAYSMHVGSELHSGASVRLLIAEIFEVQIESANAGVGKAVLGDTLSSGVLIEPGGCD